MCYINILRLTWSRQIVIVKKISVNKEVVTMSKVNVNFGAGTCSVLCSLLSTLMLLIQQQQKQTNGCLCFLLQVYGLTTLFTFILSLISNNYCTMNQKYFLKITKKTTTYYTNCTEPKAKYFLGYTLS